MFLSAKNRERLVTVYKYFAITRLRKAETGQSKKAVTDKVSKNITTHKIENFTAYPITVAFSSSP